MSITRTAVEQAIKLLTAVKAEYVIIMPDGEQYSCGIEYSPKPVPTRLVKDKYTRGERTQYCRSFMEPLNIGDVCVIPFTKYPEEDIANVAVATARDFFGPKNYVTVTESDRVEIMRVG